MRASAFAAMLVALGALFAGGCGGDAEPGASAAPSDAAGAVAPQSPDAAPPADVAAPADGASPADVAAPADSGAAPTRWTCETMAPVMETFRAGFGRVCVEEVGDRAVWDSISIPELPGSDLIRVTKFFLPVNDASGIPPSFFDANSFSRDNLQNMPSGPLTQPWHLIFAAHFLRGPAGPMSAYWGDARTAYGGYLAEIEVAGVGRVFGYYIEDDGYPCQTHKDVHAAMLAAIKLRPLYRSVFGPLPSPNTTIQGCDVPALVIR